MLPKTVLVVEDDPMLRSDAMAMLEEAGLDVVGLDNADDALAFTFDQSNELAAIFTDVQLPGICDGLHLAEVVSRHWPHIFVLVCSGHVKPIEPLPRNVRFVQKPWMPLDVLTALQNAVETGKPAVADHSGYRPASHR